MNKNIIIAILIVIIIACIGAFMFAQPASKMETQLKFTSDDTLQNGEQVIFELKDSQGNALSGQSVNITYNNNEKYSITTDQNGKGYLTINGEDAGSYDVVAEYAGNDKYDASTAKVTITITDDEADNPAQQTDSSATADTNQYNNQNSDDDNNKTNPNHELQPGDPGTHFLGQPQLWVRDSDDVIIDAPNPEWIGLTVDEWNQKYGYDSPDYH